jgi:hypothetical protein
MMINRIKPFLTALSLLVLLSLAACNRVVTRQEGWKTHQLPFYAFAYPAHWNIVASDKGDYVALYPPEDDVLRGHRIEIAYLGFEIPAEQSLESWYDIYYRAAHGDLPPNIRVLDYRLLARAEDKEVWQKLHVAVTNELGPSQAVMLAYGHLVLSIGTYTHDAGMTEILTKIADSVRFAPDAPRTLRELHGTSQAYPSRAAVLAENRRGGVVSPDTVPCDPDESSIVCQDRLASQRLTPLPPPTLSAEFLTAEAEYQQWLLRHTPTPFPPTSTPTPSYVLLPGAEKGTVLLQSRSLYQERPLFAIAYAAAAWRLEDTDEGPVLVHNTIAGCRLLWLALPTEMAEAPVIEQKELAGYTVEVRTFRRSGTIAYGFSTDRGYYSFGLFFPSHALGECQTAGETVLNTFRMVPD